MSATAALAIASAVLLVCGLLAAVLARRAGRDWFGWGVVGTVLGPIGVLLAWLERRNRSEPRDRRERHPAA